MRWLASASLFALVGCNQIFGLQATQAFDAPIDGVIDRPHVILDWQIATTTGDISSVENPIMPVPPTYAPITPAPKVRIAPLTGAFVDPVGGYTAADGKIQIPSDFITQPWRLEYTLGDGIPHEVQWKPDDKRGHLTVPIFGRVNRAPVPVDSGYTLTPTGGPAQYDLPRVFTTGLWSEGLVFAPPAGSPIDYNFAQSGFMSGPPGAPELAKADRGILINYRLDTSCRVSTGSTTFDPTLQASHQALSPRWDTTKTQLKNLAVDSVHLSDNAAPFGTTTDVSLSFLALGVLPGLQMPGLAGQSRSPTTIFNPPVMITLLQCTHTTNAFPMNTSPPPLTGMPRAIHVQVVATRSVGASTLLYGLETVSPAASNADGDTANIIFAAPFPTKISLTAASGAPLAIDATKGTQDQNPLAASADPFVLKFTPEVAPGLRGDYYDIYLRRLQGPVLVTERIFTVPAQPVDATDQQISVSIDGGRLTTGNEYTFEIHAYHGHPNAPHGDFTAVEYPYGAAILSTRTVKIM